jgi:Tfp pilus assembly protein PilO
MSDPKTTKERASILDGVLARLQNPLHLRAVLTCALLLVWYAAFYRPRAAEIDRTSARVERERKRVRLAREVESLRGQVRKFKDRLPEKTDSNEWFQYFLSMVRNHPIKLIMLDTDAPKEIGEYKAMVIRIDVEGNYRDVNQFMKRIEADRRLLRIDVIKVDPNKDGEGNVTAKLVVLGVMG